MSQKRLSLLIYALLLMICVFVLGYLVGANRHSKIIEVRVDSAQQKQIVDTVEQEPAPQQEQQDTDLVNLNTADQAELETLPGIGAALAQNILAYRQVIGEFVSIEQLMDIEGIGAQRYENIAEFVTVGG